MTQEGTMEKRGHYCAGEMCCPEESVATNLSFVAKLDRLEATLQRANNLMVEIVGRPDLKDEGGSKEPNSVAEKISIQLYDLQCQASGLVAQIERLFEAMA
jgi:hypothetical protein